VALLDTDSFNQLTKAKNGYILYNRFDRYIGRSIQEYGEFSELEADIFRQIVKEGDSVIEVGANIGTHTLVLSNLCKDSGKVIAFEPQRVVYQTLCANIALNSKTNVFAYQQALSDKNGYLNIPILDYKTTNNFGGISLQQIKEGEKVKQYRLDDFLDEYELIDGLKLIKIDVEGMEKSVLVGAKETIKRYKPILYLENDRQENSKELITYISNLGYKLYWHLPKLYNKNNYKANKNNIFNNLVSVNMLCIHKEQNLSASNFTEVTDFDFHPMRKQ